jgi:hypothetical protein
MMNVMKNSIVSITGNREVSKFRPRGRIALAFCAGGVKRLQLFLHSLLHRYYRACRIVRCSDKFSVGIQQSIPLGRVE